MKTETISLECLVRRLYDARQAAAAAKKAHIEHAAKVGECEHIAGFSYGEENDVRCFDSTRETWCSVCLDKKPLFDDYRSKSALAGAALRNLLRAAKAIPPKDFTP